VKPKLLPLHPLMAAIGAGALIMSVWLHRYFPAWRWHQEPLHSAVEAIGGLAAIAMGIVLLQRTDPIGIRFYPVASGFLGMGLLEIFHAVAEPGDAFILLRSMASLVGGIGFALIWLPPSDHAPHHSNSIAWTATAAAVGFGVWALWFPEQVPPMIRDDAFTPTAVAPQSVACMLFLASAFRFSSNYRRAGSAEDSLFASLAFLFALAEVMFVYSTVWDSRWWFWHGIRLTAYLLVLNSMVQGYRRMVLDLQCSLAQTTQAEETARLSEEQLRDVLERRERMAQDLHDGIIQSLFALGLNLERCLRLVMKNPQEAVDQLGLSSGRLKAIIRDLRGHITGLEPKVTEGRDLAPILEALAGTMEASAELRCRVEIDPEAADRMTAEQARHIVYIVREALSNSVRHAQARNELISLQRHDERAQLIIEDDGNGFKPDLVDGGGEGLKNMAARANKLGARFEVRSQAGQGTRLIFDIPLERMHV
jgi:signal transduction histidine kinase